MNVLKSLNYALHAGVLLLSLAACSVASQRARAQLLSDPPVWSQIQPEQTQAPAGWSVRPCEGNGPFLCVYATGNFVGSIEIAIYPLETLPQIQQALSVATAPQTLEHTRRLAVLTTWVQDHYALFHHSRQVEYGDRITIQTQAPEIVQVGTLPGLRYEVHAVEVDHQIKEAQIGYVSLDDNALYVVHTAFDPASVTATVDSFEHLAQFKPYLTQLVANLQLPPQS